MTDDSPIDNDLPVTTRARNITSAPPFDLPAVTVMIERNGSRLPVPALAIGWTRDAVHVRFDDEREAWLRAEDVTRR